MQIQENISLKPFNAFAINTIAEYFTKFHSIDEVDEIFSSGLFNKKGSIIILGGGSNILLTQNLKGLVAINDMTGIEVVKQSDEHAYVRAAAGENWHQFVLYCIERNFAGIENLSLIPGSVGASPMQNIGAYGVEIKDVFYELEAYSIEERKVEIFSLKDCEFGYRESVFKRKYKGKFVITGVTFKLDKQPVFKTNYGAIPQELERMGVHDLSIKAISQAVINLRRGKLPDPKEIGNAGSFFKNPLIGKQQYEELQKEFPAIIGFPANDMVKVAAGWLIEQCGWKGYRKGDAGCYSKQALVLVNYGNASGVEIYNLSTEIMHSVEEKFGIVLEREVNVV